MAIETIFPSPQGRVAPRAAAEAAVVAALFAAGFAWMFRRWLFAGFDGIFGDDADGLFLLTLLEHWNRVLSGAAAVASPSFFHPEPGTLGYSDSFFLYGVAFALVRRLGADTYTAFMVVMAALSAIGYFGFLALVRRHLAVPTVWAAVGAFLFAFANMEQVKLIHVQAYCAMLLPVLCGLVVRAWSSETRWRATVLAAAAGLLHALILLTAYQTGWFFTLFCLLIAALLAVISGPAQSLALIRRALGEKRHVVVAYLAAFVVGLVPFLVLYLPVALSGHQRTLAEILGNAPYAGDILNVTPGNWLWGGLLQSLGIVGRPGRPTWEVELGHTPVVLAMIAATIAVTAWRIRSASQRDRLVLALAVAVVASWLAQLDYFGIRPWEWVVALVPGAGAVRYSFRSQLVANFFTAIVVARALAAMAGAAARACSGEAETGSPRRTCATRQVCSISRSDLIGICSRRHVLAGACAILIVVEQVNTEWPPTISRAARIAWLAAVPSAPPECRAFYLVPNAAPVDKPGYEHQLDAMLLSQLRAIPTINGYSSWFPAGWDLEEPAKPSYPAAVRAWARDRALDGLCGLDPRRGLWTPGLPGAGSDGQ
jgi:hypothetical protein